MPLKGDTAILARKLDNISNKLCCLVNNGDSNACGCNCQPLQVELSGETTLTDLLDKLCLLLEEQENNLICSSAKACDADCNVVICHTCYTVEGEKLPTTHTNPDDTPYTGDLATLDLGCVACGEPIPTFEIITKDICLEDCSRGCHVLKVNTLTDEITLVNTLGQDGLPTTLAPAPCSEYQILTDTKCES